MGISRRQIILLAVLSAISLGAYLLTSHFVYRIGFPLDDAWIHQTYARNLAAEGEWAFIIGQPSGGSTGPLWGVFLSIGHLLRIGPYWGTFLLGWASLWGMSILGVYAVRQLSLDTKANFIWGGVLLTLEWHLVWSAGSGMETLTFSLLVTLVLVSMMRKQENLLWWLGIGALIGLSSWLRPDGITLLGPALFIIVFSKGQWKSKITMATSLAFGFLLLFGPYLAFNQALSGAWWPNTFFAKQAEYAEIVDELSLSARLMREFKLPLVGVGIALLPGFLIQAWHSFRQRKRGESATVIWVLGYLTLYALRLPVDYQHGRYVIPMMPVFFILGFAGFSRWVKPDSAFIGKRILSKTWLVTIPIILFSFWVRGAIAYAHDVAIIETEMVHVARWIAENTPEDALVAAHDIGAIGYLGNRELLDLAGLISPDVIPFIRDEAQLWKYLESQEAEYLVTFPSWYPDLVNHTTLIYQTSGSFSPQLGGENMAVYQMPGP